MATKRKARPVDVPVIPETKDKDIKMQLLQILNKIVTSLFNTKVILAVVALMGTIIMYQNSGLNTHAESLIETKQKEEKVDSTWRQRNDAWKKMIDYKLDILISQTKKH